MVKKGISMHIPLEHLLFLSVAIFAIGLFGLLLNRNLVFILLSVEIMLNSAAFAFVAVSSHFNEPQGQIMFLIIVAMAGAEVAVALALVLQFERRFKTLDVDAAHKLKG